MPAWTEIASVQDTHRRASARRCSSDFCVHSRAKNATNWTETNPLTSVLISGRRRLVICWKASVTVSWCRFIAKNPAGYVSRPNVSIRTLPHVEYLSRWECALCPNSYGIVLCRAKSAGRMLRRHQKVRRFTCTRMAMFFLKIQFVP